MSTTAATQYSPRPTHKGARNLVELSRCWMPTMKTSITAAFKMGNRARTFSERPRRWVT